MSECSAGRAWFGPVNAEPLGQVDRDLLFGTPAGVTPGVDLSRFITSIDLKPERASPRLAKGDRVRLGADDGPVYVVTDVDDDGNGTLDLAP